MRRDGSAPIGVFDSGVGGLTVVQAIHRQLPNESVLYVGDTARVPYGPKSPETVRRYARQISEWLVEQGVKAIVIACNTATAHALPQLRSELPVPVFGVIEPGARAGLAAAGPGAVGVIGTTGTIRSGAYEVAMRRVDPARVVHTMACPLLVPLVEEGWTDHAATRLIVREYCEPLRNAHVAAVVLGCTHYPLLRDVLASELGPDIRLVDSAEETAVEVAARLRDAQLLARVNVAVASPWLRVVVSDAPQHFAGLAAQFLGWPLHALEQVVFT